MFALFPHPGRLRATVPALALSRRLRAERLIPRRLARLRAMAEMAPPVALGAAWQRIPEFTGSALEHWMPHLRSDLGERFQHESALVHSDMRHRQAFGLNDRISEQKNININQSRTLFLQTPPAHLHFDIKNSAEQLFGHFFGIELDDTVQEPGLGRDFNRFGLVKRRYCQHFTQASQMIDRCS